MKNLVNYLNFDGNARDAMTFYHACLGGDLNIQTFNARFGMLTDRFGVSWMFNCEIPKKG